MSWLIAAVAFMAITYAVLAASIWAERRRQRLQHNEGDTFVLTLERSSPNATPDDLT